MQKYIIWNILVMTLIYFVSQLKEVVLKSGKVLRADVCVIGAGDEKFLQNFLPKEINPPFLMIFIQMSLLCPLLKEVFLPQVSWNKVASTWTPEASSQSTRYVINRYSIFSDVFD